MNWKHLAFVADTLIAGLPMTNGTAWCVNELCDRVAQSRGKNIMILPVDIPGLPFGISYSDKDWDCIIYRAEFTGYYRDHVILHELCHVLRLDSSGWEGRVRPPKGRALPARGGKFSLAEPCDPADLSKHPDPEEELAELFATRVLKYAHRGPIETTAGFESRVASVFGIR